MFNNRHKNTLTLAALISLPITASALNMGNAPDIVISNFKKQHPDQKIERISKETHFDRTLYEVKLYGPRIEHEQALYNEKGEEVAHETPIDIEALPKAVRETINTEFAGFKILDAEKISLPASQLVEYEADLSNGTESWEVVLNPEGQLLAKKQE